MSEAMSSVEIEDVLSSIRRLVSDELRPGGRGPSAKGSKGDKLILSPALRVVVDREPAPEPAYQEPIVPARSTLPRLHLGADPVIEEVVATLERAVEAQSLEWESEVGDPAPDLGPMEWDDTEWAAPGEEEVAAQVEPKGATTAEIYTPTWGQDDPGEEAAPVAEVAQSTIAPEAPAATTSDHRWADQAEAEVLAKLDDAPEMLFDDLPGEGRMTFDEAVLRDLVRDLIREELMGSLGERITRNVRKLVRAEIARAMTAQELE